MLKDSIVKFLKLDSLIANLTGFVETKVELLKYEVKDDIARISARAALYIVVGILILFFLILFSVALAITIGEKLGWFWGFSIVSFFYLCLSIGLLIFRVKIIEGIEKGVKNIIHKKK